MVLRSCRSMCQTYMKANSPPDLFKNLMKPNFTPPASRNFTAKALGFTRSMVRWSVYGGSRVFLFLGFWWYPFNPTYDTMIPFSKIDTYGAVWNPPRTSIKNYRINKLIFIQFVLSERYVFRKSLARFGNLASGEGIG